MPGSECCEHCAEIPLLREEAAALRARLNALTALPLSVSGPLPLQADLDVAAKTPLRQMPLFGPVHGPRLPQIDHESSSQAKVSLYRTLFVGRRSVLSCHALWTTDASADTCRNSHVAPNRRCSGASIMIVASSGQYLAVSGHGPARWTRRPSVRRVVRAV
jgi:hypothetical protein